MRNLKNHLYTYLESGRGISPDYWLGLKPEEHERFVGSLVQHYMTYGYPFHEFDKQTKVETFRDLLSQRVDSLIQGDVVRQNFCAQSLCWSYFPHSLSVSCKAFRSKSHRYNTVNEVIADENLLRTAILGVLRMAESSGSVFSHSSFANHVKISRSTQHVSNFRPSAAKALYQKYAKDKVVWDMSCGFGGRLMGAMTATVKKYIGTDPSTPTMEGLERIVKDFGRHTSTVVELHKEGSEEFTPSEPVDFCFTSPPYFDTEQYTNEKTQSYIKFPTRESWLHGFVRKTTEHCWDCLKRNGLLAYNIHADMEESFLRMCRKVGFRHIDTLQLRLSKMPGKAGRTKHDLYKNEPILVFEKRIS